MNPTIFSTYHPEALPFIEAATQGRFLLPRCRKCGKAHWYPRVACPFCFSAVVEWDEDAGTGEIYAFSFARNAGKPDHIVAYVRLDGGPTMLTNILAENADGLSVGQRVRVKLEPDPNGLAAPKFVPV